MSEKIRIVLGVIFLVNLGFCIETFNITQCESTKKCLFIPPDCNTSNTCRRIFSYSKEDDQWVKMELLNVQTDPDVNYVAIGFSKDENMVWSVTKESRINIIQGDEPVTHCAFDQATNKPEVHLSQNIGKSNSPAGDNGRSLESSNLEIIAASRENGKMYCAWKQRITPETDNAMLPNLNNDYYILLAHGQTTNPSVLAPHPMDSRDEDSFPYVSSQKISPVSFQADSPSPSDDSNNSNNSSSTGPWMNATRRRTFVLTHGIIMVLAWIFLITNAIYAARYLRNHWPRMDPNSLRVWFLIHRAFNILAVVLIAVSAFIIFFAKNFTWRGPAAWKKPEENWTAGAIHSLLGTIVIILAFIQPIGSIFRCSPGASKRPIFNALHRSIGITAYTLAVCVICIAVFAFNVWSSRGWAIAAIVIFILTVILVLVIGEFLRSTDRRLQSQPVHFEMKNSGPLHRRGDTITEIRRPKDDPKPKWGLSVLMVSLLFISAIVAVVLAFLIAQSGM